MDVERAAGAGSGAREAAVDSCKLGILCRRLIRPRKSPIIELPFIILSVVGYGVLFLGFGKQFLPGHGPWCTLLLWAAGHLGGLIAYYMFFGMPVIFGMPVMLGFMLGFIMKAVGPGLVVPAMFRLNDRGLGTGQGIPQTVVVAASLDDALAMTGFAIFSNVAIHEKGVNEGWDIAEGPMQIVFGIVGGILLGAAMGCTRIFRTPLHRAAGTYGACLLIMLFLQHWGQTAGGAVGALTTGLVASQCWAAGFPRLLSAGPSPAHKAQLQSWMGPVWTWVWEVMLFVTIGSSINFATLQSGTVAKSVGIIFAGLSLRACITFATMHLTRQGYSLRECLFYAVAWTPKATIQAALSATPLAMIKKAHPGDAQWLAWGEDILTTGIFTIIVCAPLGLTAIHLLAPRLLRLASKLQESEDANDEDSKEDGAASTPRKHTSGAAGLPAA